MSNSNEFLTAAKYVKKLKTTPSNEELLNLYKFYKQATVGDINTPKPSIIYFKDVSKWDSWNSVKGFTKYSSEVKYISFVNLLIKNYGIE